MTCGYFWLIFHKSIEPLSTVFDEITFVRPIETFGWLFHHLYQKLMFFLFRWLQQDILHNFLFHGDGNIAYFPYKRGCAVKFKQICSKPTLTYLTVNIFKIVVYGAALISISGVRIGNESVTVKKYI